MRAPSQRVPVKSLPEMDADLVDAFVGQGFGPPAAITVTRQRGRKAGQMASAAAQIERSNRRDTLIKLLFGVPAFPNTKCIAQMQALSAAPHVATCDDVGSTIGGPMDGVTLLDHLHLAATFDPDFRFEYAELSQTSGRARIATRLIGPDGAAVTRIFHFGDMDEPGAERVVLVRRKAFEALADAAGIRQESVA